MVDSLFNYSRVLIILPERLGDVLFHTPSLQFLKKHRPQTHIGIIALSPLCASVLENNPYIGEIFVTPDQQQCRDIASRYDIVLNVHNHGTTRHYIDWLDMPTIVAELADEPRHHSGILLDYYSQLLDQPFTEQERRYTLFPNAANHKKIKTLLQNAGATISVDSSANANDDILVGCHIGCHSIAKRGIKFWKPLQHPKVWPLDRFVELALLLQEQGKKHGRRIRFVITGTKTERALGDKFAQKVPGTIDLIDQTSVNDLAALMQYLTLFVTPDTGTLHVAGATDIGIIALFGPTFLYKTGPYPPRDNYRILQAQSITDISVERVRDAIVSHPDFVRRLAANASGTQGIAT